MKRILLTTGFVLLLFVAPAWAQIGGGNVTFKVSGAGDVVYTHEFHVGQRGLGCSECHYHVFARAANNFKDRATMAEMQNGKSCGSCHNGRKAFGLEKNCARCHGNDKLAAGQ